MRTMDELARLPGMVAGGDNDRFGDAVVEFLDRVATTDTGGEHR